MTENVFTVFFHGTAFGRDSNPDELVGQLSRAMSGREARIVQTSEPTREDPLPYRLESRSPTYLICEGPGSKSVPADRSDFGVEHDRPGVFNPLLGLRKERGHSDRLNPALTPKGARAYWIVGDRQTSGFQDAFMGNTAGASRPGGLMLGRGWNDNVYKTAWLLTHLKWSEGMPIDTVNLVGWSRGSVSCMKTANKIFEVFEDTLDVNVFAVDPVPGGLNAITDDMHLIPPNVRNLVAVLALDENGSFFEALDRETMRYMAPRSQHGTGGNPDSRNPEHIKPRVHFLPFPGNHADVVDAGPSSDEVRLSARLIRALAWKFLAAHGTCFDGGAEGRFGLTPADALPLYRKLMSDMPAIADAARTFVMGGHGFARDRHVAAQRSAYVSEPERYLNEHHRALELAGAYPAPSGPKDAFTPDDWASWNADQTMDDWSQWSGGKSLDLPAAQTHLGRLRLL